MAKKQDTTDLVTFTEEILNEKLHFLCAVNKEGTTLLKNLHLIKTGSLAVDITRVPMHTFFKNLEKQRFRRFTGKARVFKKGEFSRKNF